MGARYSPGCHSVRLPRDWPRKCSPPVIPVDFLVREPSEQIIHSYLMLQSSSYVALVHPKHRKMKGCRGLSISWGLCVVCMVMHSMEFKRQRVAFPLT